MPYKKKAIVKKVYKKKPKVAKTTASAVRAIVKKELNKNLETKQSNYSNTDYQQIGHNSAVNIDNELLRTTQGTSDPQTGNTLNRIGDQITLKGISIKMMLELNERYGDVSYRILIVKSAKGDTPSNTTLFNGLSGNKMLDTINRERFTICYEKWGKIVARNLTAGNNPTQLGTSTGIYAPSTQFDNAISRATKIVKIWLPYSKLTRNPNITYENNLGQVKQNDYNVLVYAYSNYSTSELLGYNVMAINDYVKTMYFKDA